MPTKLFFQAGGSLGVDLPSYVERRADFDLYNKLQEGDFCYVLTARQMGKSSLKVRIMNKLVKEGWATASVDLTAFGTTDFTSEQWYQSFLSEIADALEIDKAFDNWWETKKGLTPVARMSSFWEEVALKEKNQKIVIFIDEVDSMLSLEKNTFSTDDFFAAIRSTYNRRSENPEYNRLNFSIFGVATPQDLMGDHERTPFNIGTPIIIQNFSLEEAKPLQKGFSNAPQTNFALLKRIFYWTEGQPFLTQELCQSLHRKKCTLKEVNHLVDETVVQNFFKPGIFNEPHFSNIQTRILSNDTYNVRMLDIYKIVLHDGFYSNVQRGNEQLYLKLSGLVQESEGKLKINNRIYTQIFNEDWLQKAYGSIKRPVSVDLQRWLNSERSKDALLKGSVLVEAEAWAATRDDLTNLERDFLQASRLAELEAEQERLLQIERNRQSKRLRVALAIAVFAAIIATGMGIYGFKQASIAEEQTRVALTQTKIAEREKINAEEALKQFKQEQADKISREIDDIITRAKNLKANGYENSQVWRNLLNDAQAILNDYQENEFLRQKQLELNELLQ